MINDREDPMRPLLEIPKWDGKLVLAGLFIIGYYSLVLIMAWRPLPASNAALIRDAMLTLGPVVGLIFGALFRTTGAEERRDAMRSTETLTAIQTPSTVAPTGAVADRVEEGARSGTRAGVNDALNAANTSGGGVGGGAPAPAADAPYEGPDLPDDDVAAPEEAKWQ